MDTLINQLECSIISERQFLAASQKVAGGSRTYAPLSSKTPWSRRAPSALPFEVLTAYPISIEDQLFAAMSIVRDRGHPLRVWKAALERDERALVIRLLERRNEEIDDRDKAMLLALAIKYNLTAPLPGQPAYTGPITLHDSAILISGQPIPISAYLNPDPTTSWPEQRIPQVPSEVESVSNYVGYTPRNQRQLVFRVFTRYVHRLPEIVSAALKSREDIAYHPNLVVSESDIIVAALDAQDMSQELAAAALLVLLKYQVIDPLPGQTRYEGVIRYNPAVREVTIDNIPILPQHLAPGPSYEPSKEERSPVSPYVTIGTSPGASGVTPIEAFSSAWQETFDLTGLAGPKLATQCREVLDYLSEFARIPTGRVKVILNPKLEDAGRYTHQAERIEFGRTLVSAQDTFLHEIGHWFAYPISGGSLGDMTKEPFYTVHAAIIDQYERNQDRYPLLRPELMAYVGDAAELWARAFEGYFYLKIGHEGECRVFDTSRPAMLRNLAWWDRDEFAKYIFPQMEDVFVRAGIVE